MYMYRHTFEFIKREFTIEFSGAATTEQYIQDAIHQNQMPLFVFLTLVVIFLFFLLLFPTKRAKIMFHIYTDAILNAL